VRVASWAARRSKPRWLAGLVQAQAEMAFRFLGLALLEPGLGLYRVWSGSRVGRVHVRVRDRFEFNLYGSFQIKSHARVSI